MAASNRDKCGKLKPLNPKSVAPAIRLVSTAVYTRHVVQDTTGVPMNSTYRATISDHAKDGADMRARCVATRGEMQRHDMVRAAARLIPPAALDRMHAAAETTFRSETLQREQAGTLEAAAAADMDMPFVTPAIAAFSRTLAAEPSHPATATMTNQFFTAGSSELGKVLAGSYWVDNGPPSAFHIGPKQPKRGPDGNPYHNHAHI